MTKPPDYEQIQNHAAWLRVHRKCDPEALEYLAMASRLHKECDPEDWKLERKLRILCSLPLHVLQSVQVLTVTLEEVLNLAKQYGIDPDNIL